MAAKGNFPGQVVRGVFTLEQIKSLASSIRTEVFWSFTESEPMSAADVAQALGKSAQTIHYHVNELLRVGLLLQVGTRKRHARTENLFVHAAKDFYGAGPSAPAEYRQYIQKGFAAITRAMVRENAALHKVYDRGDVSIADFTAYVRATLRLSPENAVELRRRILLVVEEARELEIEDGVRVNAAFYMTPTQAESRNWLKKKPSKKRVKG